MLDTENPNCLTPSKHVVNPVLLRYITAPVGEFLREHPDDVAQSLLVVRVVQGGESTGDVAHLVIGFFVFLFYVLLNDTSEFDFFLKFFLFSVFVTLQ